MDAVKIGEDAGRVWEALSFSNEGLSLSKVKKTTTLKDAEANLALGWLAREGKIIFIKKGNAINISLV